MSSHRSRLPRPDEGAVLDCLSLHIKQCRNGCDYATLSSPNRLIKPTSFCIAGRSFAVDLLKYLYFYRGTAYSTYEQDEDGSAVSVDLGLHFLATRLLSAVESGLVFPESETQQIQPLTARRRSATSVRVERTAKGLKIFIPKGVLVEVVAD